MITKTLEDALNKQINKELFSAYLYLSMAAYFEANSFEGMSTWMKVQSQEELTHAMKFYNYILTRGGKVQLAELGSPKVEWESPLDAFKSALEHEQYITSSIYDLVDIATQNRDHTTNVFLQWFVTEQLEEEDSAQKIIDKIKMVKDSSDGLFLIDRELGTRVFTMPAANTTAA